MMDYQFDSYAEVTLGEDIFIGKYCVLGCPKEQGVRRSTNTDTSLAEPLAPVKISDRCIIFHHVSIYEGVEIGDGSIVEDHVRIGYGSIIGSDVRLMHGAHVCDQVRIGDHARVSGLVCDGAMIGRRSTVMGNILHEYSRPHLGWWEVDETPPIIEDDVVIGWGANVIGAIRVSSRSYVASGAIVTKDVPPEHIVRGVNDQIPLRDWDGERLSDWIGHWSHD